METVNAVCCLYIFLSIPVRSCIARRAEAMRLAAMRPPFSSRQWEGRGEGQGGAQQVSLARAVTMTADIGPAHSRYVRVKKFAELTGYTEKAIYHKIENGTWLQGRHYRRAPDGHICIDMEGFYRWVEEAAGPASNR